MATKNKTPIDSRSRRQKAADAVTYKVTAALFLLFLSIVALKKLSGFYETIAGFDLLYPASLWLMLGGIVLAVVCAALVFSLRKPVVRFLAPWGIGIGFMVSLTSYAMRTTYTDDFSLLYVICGALLVLYIIFQLYRWDFFLFSVTTFLAGATFYLFSRGSSALTRAVVLLVLLVIAKLIGLITYKDITKAKDKPMACKDDKGRLRVGRLLYPMFSPRFNPLPIYIGAAFWLVCAVAVLFLGPLFSYYCMFAAIVAEFIAAVYYTIQLR